MRKWSIIVAVCLALFFTPMLLQGQSWTAGFLRDNTGALLVTCRNGTSGDDWQGGFRRDQNGALDITNCTAAPTPVPTATPTPPVTAAYAPSYIQQGTSTSGGGGNDNAGALILSGTQFVSLNVRYIEGDRSGTFAVSGVNSCNEGANCWGVWYNKLNNLQCTEGAFVTNVYNAIDALANGSTDTGFIHDVGGSLAAAGRTGQFGANGFIGSTATCAHNTKGTYVDPADPTGTLASAETTDYFTNSSWLNSDHNTLTRWDNSTLVNDTQEYGSGNVALTSYTQNYATFLDSFGYPYGLNNGGTGGSFYQWNHITGANTAFGCTNGVCNDIDDYCAHATNAHFYQWERPFSPNAYASSSYFAKNIPFILNTLSHMYNDPGCNNVDVVFLDDPNGASGSGDNVYKRDIFLAGRIISEPGGYNGTASARSSMSELYLEPSSKIAQNAIYPEYGIQFIPDDSGMAAYSYSSGSSDGNGCNPGDSGGAKAYLVHCDTTNKDDQGFPGAIYSRHGHCKLFNVDKGECDLLINEGNTDETIADNYCQMNASYSPCTSYRYYWHYVGTGPETFIQDNSSLGTVCTTANGCNGKAGETSTTNPLPGVTGAWKLGHCPGPLDNGGTGSSPTLLTEDCTALLMMN